MSVRAKFRVTGIDLRSGMVATEKTSEGRPVYAAATLPTVRLSPVSPAIGSEETEENKAFWEATPQGSCEITVTNPDAAEFFGLNEDYYLDFTRV